MLIIFNPSEFKHSLGKQLRKYFAQKSAKFGKVVGTVTCRRMEVACV